MLENEAREQQKNEMKERTAEGEREVRSSQFREKETERRRDALRGRLIVFSLALSCFLFAMFFMHNYTYSTYSVDTEMTVSSIANAKLYSYQDGNIVVGSDSVSYVLRNETSWTAAMSVAHPMFATEGKYFCLFSNGGYQAYIGDESGINATIRVSRPIRSMDISEAGVVAICTESKDTAYVTYYDRFGSRIAVDVKTTLNVSGYPVCLSISPDGQKLCVLYYSVANGIGESRLVFYDFQKGRAENSYVVGTFEDFFEEDSFLVRCEFTDNRHVTVIGDKSFLFLTYNGNERLSRRTVPVEGSVRSAVFARTELVAVVDRGGECVCLRYEADGRLKNAFPAPENYTSLAVNTDFVLFRDGADIRFYNASGKLRYTGTLTEDPVSVCFIGNRSLFINTGKVLRKITLK